MIVQMKDDITKYEVRVFGPFTKRMLITSVIAVPLALAVFFLMYNLTGDTTISGLLLITIIMTAFVIGVFKKNGIYMTEYLAIRKTENAAPNERAQYDYNLLEEYIKTAKEIEREELKLEKTKIIHRQRTAEGDLATSKKYNRSNTVCLHK